MKVLLIHQAFVSGQEAGGTRHYELGQRLKQHNDQLIVVASQVSYLTGKRIHPGQSKLLEREDLDGVHVLRAYTLSMLHKGFARRIAGFVVFALTSIWAGLRSGHVDLVMGTTPPIFQAFSAWLVAFLRRKPFLLEVRDLWPEFAIDMGVLKNRWIIALARLGERFLYAQADHLLVNSPAYRDYLLKKGVPARKISFVANGVEIGMFDPTARGEAIRQQYDLSGKFVITYAGAHGPANDLGIVLRAADRLRSEPQIHFLMVGDGKDRETLQTQAVQMGLTNVTFTGALPKSLMPDILAASDACLAILMNIPMFTTTYPNKVFDYMAAGRPTLLAIDGVIREVVEAAEAGIFVPPGNVAALAEKAAYLAKNPDTVQRMGTAAREYVATHFNREQQADEFRAVLHMVAFRRSKPLYSAFKRVLDVVLALCALIILSPIILGTAIAIRLTMGAPVFFQQQRPGLFGKPFMMRKFRTMRNSYDADGNLLPDADRLTSLGKFLRSTSLDELPELFNVLRGEMSIVGPRPLLMQYLNRYTPEQSRRHDVKPGITGWAQINGRNALTWEEKFALDTWYVDHRSLWLDLRIILLTIQKVLRREGITQEGHATMSEFQGTAEPRQ